MHGWPAFADTAPRDIALRGSNIELAGRDPARVTRSMLGRLAAESSWANTKDRSGRTAPARAAFEAKVLEQADGDPVRAAHLRKAFYARLALRSAKAPRGSH